MWGEESNCTEKAGGMGKDSRFSGRRVFERGGREHINCV
jgi:hypothetical protein